MNAVSNATVTFVGQNYGAKKPKRIKKSVIEASIMIIAISLLWTLVLLTAGQYIARLYTSDPEVIGYACARMKIILPIYFVCGIVEVLVGCMRGMGYSFTPMVANFFCICVFRIVWIYTACKVVNTPEMLYLSWPISWVLNIIVDGVIMAIIYKREKQKLLSADETEPSGNVDSQIAKEDEDEYKREVVFEEEYERAENKSSVTENKSMTESESSVTENKSNETESESDVTQQESDETRQSESDVIKRSGKKNNVA